VPNLMTMRGKSTVVAGIMRPSLSSFFYLG
jgi:hypothetical protein